MAQVVSVMAVVRILKDPIPTAETIFRKRREGRLGSGYAAWRVTSTQAY